MVSIKVTNPAVKWSDIVSSYLPAQAGNEQLRQFRFISVFNLRILYRLYFACNSLHNIEKKNLLKKSCSKIVTHQTNKKRIQNKSAEKCKISSKESFAIQKKKKFPSHFSYKLTQPFTTFHKTKTKFQDAQLLVKS